MARLYTTKNVDRIRVIQDYLRGQYTRKMAAINLGVTERQIARIVQKYLENGPESVIHGNTGRITNCKYSSEFKRQIISFYKEKYGKNGIRLNFRHFQDKLAEDGIHVPYSSLRRILLEGGIRPVNPKKAKVISPPRSRRAFAGELVQMDASTHRWLYKDFHNYALHGAIDDATGIITGLWLEKEETAHGYQMVLRQTMERYGIPRCLYTDNRNIFGINKRTSSICKSQFKRLLARLGIEVITTSNPRAKGRIERAWRTLQGRLLDELYLREITAIKEANAFIQEYLPVLNKAFASNIVSSRNAFYKVPADYDYNRNLSLFKEISVYSGCYISMCGHYYVIEQHKDVAVTFPHKVWLHKFLDGSYHICFDGEWYDLQDIGPRSAHKDMDGLKRTQASQRSTEGSPWRRFNPNFLNRDQAEWDKKNYRTSHA